MAKKIDQNGYWYIKHNPISNVGVFPYLGSTISDDCEPNKVYNVLRPAETLKGSIDSWSSPKPMIDDHEMLGKGFTKVDDRPVQGIIYNPSFDENTGTLYADMAIYSEDMKDKIENGKKELSLGYFCNYKKQPGTFKGQNYDYVQTDMAGNHIALVERGRCGSAVKVFDARCTMDSFDILPGSIKGAGNPPLNTNQEIDKIDIEPDNITQTKDGVDMADKREAIRKIMAIAAKPDSDFDGGEAEKIETIAKLLESSEYSKSEAETTNDEEEKPEDKKDEKPEKSEDEEEQEIIKEEEKKKTEDSANKILRRLRVIEDKVDEILEEKKSEEKEEKSESEDEESEKEEEKTTEKKNTEDKAIGIKDKAVLFPQDRFAADEALSNYLK